MLWKNREMRWKIDDNDWENGEIYQIIMANGRVIIGFI